MVYHDLSLFILKPVLSEHWVTEASVFFGDRGGKSGWWVGKSPHSEEAHHGISFPHLLPHVVFSLFSYGFITCVPSKRPFESLKTALRYAFHPGNAPSISFS